MRYDHDVPNPLPPSEPLLALKDIATRLGLPAFKVTRAAKLGIFPTYSLFNNRKLARLSEVLSAIERSRTGGGAQ
jgi:hypothetical protein